VSEDTGFSYKGMKTCFDTTEATYRFKAERHVALLLQLHIVQWKLR